MALTIEKSSQFAKDFKRIQKRGLDLSQLGDVIETLMNEHPLDPRYHDHDLVGDYRGFKECHIKPDWLLIYSVDKDAGTLRLTRTGSHSDLFS